jgi:hypothetical protein
MTIQDKIKKIEDYTGLVFCGSYFSFGISSGSVAFFLFKKGLMDEQILIKIKSIGQKSNFWENYMWGNNLNSHSILFVNLVYEIITKSK